MADLGRPTKYKEEYNEQAYKLCLLGHTDEELAQFFEIATSTLYEWKLAYPDFSEALKKGKDIADSNVVASLYHRAMGYSHEDTDIKMYEGGIIKTRYTKHHPPDATSAIFWLKNRQPKKWRDKQVTEHEGGITIENKSMEDIFK